VTGSGTTYNVAVTGMATRGNVVAAIPAGGAQDSANNGNAASASTDNTVTWDRVPATTAPTFSPASPQTGDSLQASTTTSDPDGDNVSVAWTWKVNRGGDVCTIQTNSSASAAPGVRTASLDLSANYVPTSCTSATINPLNPSKGDSVVVEATPNDGLFDGTLHSSNVTVVNTAPVVDSASIGQSSPQTNDTLTTSVSKHDADGDTVTLAYQWQKSTNGGTSWNDLAGQTGSSLDLSVAGNGDKGDQLRVKVTPNDGSIDGASVTSAAVTVVNTAPAAGTVAIAPASPQTNDLLTATPSGFSDADGDSLTYHYTWKNGSTVVGSDSATLDLSQAGNGDKGDTIHVSVTASDGSASSSAALDSVTVQNTAPAAGTVAIAPASPQTNDLLTATPSGFSDADGDSLTYHYTWKNGSTVVGSDSATLDLSQAGNGDKGDTIHVSVTASDGSASSSAALDSVTVQNSAPSSPSLTSPADNAITNDNTPTFDWSNSTDPDADTLSYSIQANLGSCDFSGTNEVDASGLSASEFTPSTALADGTYCWRAKATDADSADSAWSSTRSVTIDSVKPSSSATSPASTNQTTFTVGYTGASDPAPSSGLDKVELYVKTPISGTYSLAHTFNSPAASDSFSYSASDGDGSYDFYSLAYDNAGNAEAVPVGPDHVTVVSDSTTLLDTAAPSSSIQCKTAACASSYYNAVCNGVACSASYYNADVTVTLNGSDTGGSGLKEIRYTTDGSTPTATNGTPIASGGTFTVSSTTTVKFVAVDNAGNVESPVNSQTINIDKVAPIVQSMNRAGASPTNAASVDWTVKFSKSVTGVDSTDFELANSGLGGSPAITNVTGSGDTYTVTASTGTGDGTLGLNLVDNDSITDSAGNKLGGTGTSGAGDGSFTGQAYTIDRTAPTVTVTAPSSPQTASTIHFTATVSEATADAIHSGDITVGGTAGATAGVVSPTDATHYDIAVSGMATSGTVTVQVKANVVHDAANNPNGASNIASVQWNQTVSSNTAPTVTINTPTFGQLHAKPANVSLNASFSDPDNGQTHTCSISWDDGTTTTPAVNPDSTPSTAGTCAQTHAYNSAGVYTISVTLRRLQSDAWVRHEAGHGRGVRRERRVRYRRRLDQRRSGLLPGQRRAEWAGELRLQLAVQEGCDRSDGETEFQFQIANFGFHSDSYNWLVVSGYKAQYKGVGTVNGVFGYDFTLTAYDGGIAGTGQSGYDRFRIKITNHATGATVFDNRNGASMDLDSANPQNIGGGSIVIHKA
jgi:hypothetical protein